MKRLQAALLVLLLTLPVAGCELIGDLFEFGLWVIFVFIVLIVLLGWALRRAFGRKRPPPV